LLGTSSIRRTTASGVTLKHSVSPVQWFCAHGQLQSLERDRLLGLLLVPQQGLLDIRNSTDLDVEGGERLWTHSTVDEVTTKISVVISNLGG
jgi:hypothetical protein